MSCRWATLAAIGWALTSASSGLAQVTYEDGPDGVRYQVVTTPRSIPVTETRDQQVTTYHQQITTETTQHQQLYTVPVTQYQLVSRLNGRWNPFVTPYWSHHYVPVTTWQQQVATVQIPVNRVSWAPETRTVQQPVTTYRTVNQIVKTPIGLTPGAASNTALAARPLSSATPAAGGWQPSTAASQPTASLAAVPSGTAVGGTQLDKSPQSTVPGGWPSAPQSADRYQSQRR